MAELSLIQNTSKSPVAARSPGLLSHGKAKPRSRLVVTGGTALLLWQCFACATAADFGTLGGFDVRLDTAVRISLGLRTEGMDQALLQNANTDDANRAFRPGVNSGRVDVTSLLDVTRGNLGFELSADGWYDAIYHRADANHDAATFNPVGIAPDQFPADTRRLLGSTIELGTAVVHDRFELAGVPVTVRVGRQSVLWGESLFFPQDGIAAGQAPVDEIKALSQPLAQNRELFLPVAQALVRADLGHGFSVQGYEQFEWRRNRSPGVASYFSVNDFADTGGERVFLPDGNSLFRGKDSTPDGFGQFGAAFRYASDVIDLGFYALRYNSKDGFIQLEPGAYHLVFPHGIEMAGVSASTYAGDSTLTAEISTRWHMPLVSNGFAGISGSSEPAPGQPAGLPRGYATGQTLTALMSYERHLPTGRLWQGANLDAELSMTDLLDVQSGAAFRLPGSTRFASSAEAVFAPQYFQVLPHLDLSVPVGVQYGLSGRSSVDPGQIARVGTVTLSVLATYRTVWQLGASFTHFLGPLSQQPLADRDFVILSMARDF